MNDTQRRRSGGRSARRAKRTETAAQSVRPYLVRNVPNFEIVSPEGLETIEYNADTILEEVGLDFRDYPRALEVLASAGAKVDGERVRFPRGMCREIVLTNAPEEYTHHARNPVRTIQVGGKATSVE